MTSQSRELELILDRIERLESKIDRMENKIYELSERVARLESSMEDVRKEVRQRNSFVKWFVIIVLSFLAAMFGIRWAPP